MVNKRYEYHLLESHFSLSYDVERLYNEGFKECSKPVIRIDKEGNVSTCILFRKRIYKSETCISIKEEEIIDVRELLKHKNK